MSALKDLRYNVMLALYFPILLYAFSTFDLNEDVYVVEAVEPVVVGERTVVLGQPFEAQALLTVAAGEGQELASEGALEVVGDSLFRMPTAGLLADDEAEKEVPYRGRFRFPQIGGGVAELPVEGTFRVRRPEIVATSEATQALYRNSLNPIRIEVPGLEEAPLRLKTGGRTVDGRSISLSPAGDGATLEVFLAQEEGDDVFLGRKSFTAIEPPRPEIRVLANGREVRNGDAIPRARAVIQFRIEADEEFRRRYPQDARYGAARARVFLRQGLTASRELGTFPVDGGQVVLTRALREARPGDRVTVQLEGVVRINHAGRAFPVELGRGTRTFGFTLS
ncbi:MAG: GldM family protein, partial [Rhodothermales bacterium]|nr:GldM family protein [Rhodothermales bacterium]